MPTLRIAIRDWNLEGERTWHIKERMGNERALSVLPDSKN